MMGLLNLGSLALGLMAWILPVINLVLHKNPRHRNWAPLSITSISSCAIALYLQIVYSDYLVQIADWSALMDITDNVVLVAAMLLIVTLILNAITWFVYRGRTAKMPNLM